MVGPRGAMYSRCSPDTPQGNRSLLAPSSGSSMSRWKASIGYCKGPRAGECTFVQYLFACPRLERSKVQSPVARMISHRTVSEAHAHAWLGQISEMDHHDSMRF